MNQEKSVFDTNVLLEYPQILDEMKNIVICGSVIGELDNINHSDKKSEETKYQARMARNAIKRRVETDSESIEYFIDSIEDSFFPYGWDTKKPDNIIIMVAKKFDAVLYTNDLLMTLLAQSVGVKCREYHGAACEDYYKGYREIMMNDDEFLGFMRNLVENTHGLLINEYLIIRDANDADEIHGMFKWTEDGMYHVPVTKFESSALGKIQPRDCYQAIAMDSLKSAPFTILTGVAGTAKTLLAMSYAFEKLKTTSCSRIVIVHDSMPLKGSVDLGAVPGTRNEKILAGSSLGDILSSKLGDTHEIERYLENEQIHLIPTSSIRGFETKPDEILLITEGQNMSIATCKLVLQRVGEGCKVIIEGDNKTQIDARNCSFSNNGMARAIEVFKGSDLFSCVELKEIYRSRICELADKM